MKMWEANSNEAIMFYLVNVYVYSNWATFFRNISELVGLIIIGVKDTFVFNTVMYYKI